MKRSPAFVLLVALALWAAPARGQDPTPQEVERAWRDKTDARLADVVKLAAEHPYDADRPVSSAVTNPMTLVATKTIVDVFSNYELIGEFRNDSTQTLSFVTITLTLQGSVGQTLLTDYTYFHLPVASRLSASSLSTNVIPPGGIGFFRFFTSVKANTVFNVLYSTSGETYATTPLLSNISLVGPIAIGPGTSLQTWSGALSNASTATRVFFPIVAVAGYLSGQINDVDFTYARSSNATSCSVTTDSTIAPQGQASFSSSFLRQVSTIGRVYAEWSEVSLSPGSQSVSSGGGAGSFAVTGECSWSAVSNASWIVITGASGTTLGTVSYTVAANTGAARSGTITAAGLTFIVTQSAPAVVSTPVMSIDGPADNSIVYQPFLTGGWAIDRGAQTGGGVDAVHVWAYPYVNGVLDVPNAIFVAQGAIGGVRSDVGAVYGPQFSASGFTFTVSVLPAGNYLLVVYCRSTVTGSFNQDKRVNITVRTTDPIMSIDGPAEGALVQQPFLTGGWAIDRAARTNTGVNDVHVWAYPIVNGVVDTVHAIFVVQGQGGGTRTDVGNFYGRQFDQSGFTFVVSGLAKGPYVLGVYARSAITGQFQGLFRTITIK